MLRHIWVLHLTITIYKLLYLLTQRESPVKGQLIKPLSAVFKIIIHDIFCLNPLPNKSNSYSRTTLSYPSANMTPTCPTSMKVATSLSLRAKTSLALITMGATATAWEKCCWFKINVIVCHRKPIWLLSLLSCAHLKQCTGLYLRMWFSLSLPSEWETDTSRFHLC